jgi:hypothetical protein
MQFDEEPEYTYEEYEKMFANPVLLPIYHWEKITKVIIFDNEPKIGSGTLYFGNSPFNSGNFIDTQGNLSQVRRILEGGWKRECYQPDYTLLFREYENDKYMYVAKKY